MSAQESYDSLLKSSTHVTNKLKQELQEVRSQLDRECADREEIEVELSDLRKKSATAREFPEPADLLNQLKARRKKSGANLADMEAVLDILTYLEE